MSITGPPVIPEMTPGNREAFTYVELAQVSFLKAHHAACANLPTLTHKAKPDYGSPSPLMLSTFAVFKVGAKAALPQSFPLGGRAFVNYVRIAQERFGWPFKVIPVVNTSSGFSAQSSHCLHREASAVHARIARAPASIKATALQIELELQLYYQYVARNHEGICVSGYHGGSLCEPLVGAEERGGLSLAATSTTNPVVFYLAPNGVVKITVHYPQVSAKGYPPGSPSRSVTVPVINNLAIWQMTREPGSVRPTIEWRAANGRIIRTVTPF
jgi:hypothetical protein